MQRGKGGGEREIGDDGFIEERGKIVCGDRRQWREGDSTPLPCFSQHTLSHCAADVDVVLLSATQAGRNTFCLPSHFPCSSRVGSIK